MQCIVGPLNVHGFQSCDLFSEKPSKLLENENVPFLRFCAQRDFLIISSVLHSVRFRLNISLRDVPHSFFFFIPHNCVFFLPVLRTRNKHAPFLFRSHQRTHVHVPSWDVTIGSSPQATASARRGRGMWPLRSGTTTPSPSSGSTVCPRHNDPCSTQVLELFSLYNQPLSSYVIRFQSCIIRFSHYFLHRSNMEVISLNICIFFK